MYFNTRSRIIRIICIPAYLTTWSTAWHQLILALFLCPLDVGESKWANSRMLDRSLSQPRGITAEILHIHIINNWDILKRRVSQTNQTPFSKKFTALMSTVDFLQYVGILGLKKVGHFANNLPEIFCPNIMAKSWSIYGRTYIFLYLCNLKVYSLSGNYKASDVEESWENIQDC